MILVDRALDAREHAGSPIRVGMIGAGFMGRGIALSLLSRRGIRLVGIANRHGEGAARAYAQAGQADVRAVDTARQVDAAVATGRYVVTENPEALATAEQVDIVVEVTGTVEFAAQVTLSAINHGKHVVLMNAELDATVGPILKRHADRAGVILTNADGDQPGVIMNLYRFVRGIGVRPVLCGNIKGLQDPYRTPETQREFARKWGQNPRMVTAFADGSKISFEQAIVANATGMRVGRRGMFGPVVETGTPVQQVATHFPLTALLDGPGIVDYVVGAEPAPGVFVLGVHDHPVQQHYLKLFKLGDGPLYCFYTPYHLCHFEVANTIARAALFDDATIAPLGRPEVEVVATAKADLREGDLLDGIGGFMLYGQCESAGSTAAEGLLPLGLAEGCRLRRAVPKDAVLRQADVDVPEGRLVDRLRREQERVFAPAAALEGAAPATLPGEGASS